ncbi:MAG TPA: HEAT repeat domain-containing protein [Gemmataceae bacterium]
MPVATANLVRLLKTDQPADVRRAAAVVIAELDLRDAAVATAIREALDDPDPAVRLQAIQAVGRLKIDAALPQLIDRIRGGGPEAEQAAEAAVRLGSKGTKALQGLMPKVAPGLRRYIAAALASGGTGADAAALAMLRDKDPNVVESAVRSLVGKIPTLTPAQHRALTGELLTLAGNKKAPLPASTEAAVVRLLAVLNDPRAAAALWARVGPPHPPEIRAAALQALGKWVTNPGKEQLQRLFAAAGEADFRVAAPALMMLQRLPAGERALAGWLDLLRAPDVAVRRLALQKVGDRDDEDVVEALLEQTRHPDRELREGSYARLTATDRGRKALTKALLGAETADQAWPLARALAPYAGQFPPKWRESVFKDVCEYLEANDRRADALLFLLREADAEELKERVREKALAWRKKKDYATAILYLRLLTRDPTAGWDTRLELAACGLKVSAKELPHDARAADPALHQLAQLCQQDPAGLFKQLSAIKWLDPDDLYYVGFHFAEQGGYQRQFGADVLKLVLKRSPRSKVAQAAKSKLRSVGLN